MLAVILAPTTIRDALNLLVGQAMYPSSHKGVWIHLPNGWTASVQCGPGNYCDHRNTHRTSGDLADPRGDVRGGAAWLPRPWQRLLRR